MTEEEPLLPPPEQELQLPPPRPRSDRVLNIARLELQLPTRLLRGYHDYQAEPDWQELQIAGSPSETNERLKTMPGRNDGRWNATAYALYDTARFAYRRLSAEEQEELRVFRAKRGLFIDSFMRQYTPAFRVFRDADMRTKHHPPLDAEGDISLRIVSEHSVVVALVAQRLAQMLSSQLLKEKVEREQLNPELIEEHAQFYRQRAIDEVVFGALLHDTNKIAEVQFDNLTQAEKLSAIRRLVKDGYGSMADIDKVLDNPQVANVVHEELKNRQRYHVMREDPELRQRGNIDSILEFAGSTGMPVVRRQRSPGGHYLDSLGAQIVYMADKLVFHTGLVSDLEAKHQYALQDYGPEEEVNKEYEYAAKLAGELAQKIPGLHSGADLPKYVIDSLLDKISRVDMGKPSLLKLFLA